MGSGSGTVLYHVTRNPGHLLLLQFRDSERAFRLYGPPTIQQEVDREMASAQAQVRSQPIAKQGTAMIDVSQAVIAFS